MDRRLRAIPRGVPKVIPVAIRADIRADTPVAIRKGTPAAQPMQAASPA